jgi:hypothetical protein
VLELAFATEGLRSVSEDAACAYEAYGQVVADSLIARLADLRAASHVLEVPLAEVRAASDSEPEHVVIPLAAGRSLFLCANHARPPRSPTGALVWERINRVRIIRLE